MTFEHLLDYIIPDLNACQTAASELRRKHPDLNAQSLAARVVRTAQLKAAATGAATGTAAGPITMLPAALADMATTLRIEATMAGTVGALLDPSSLLDRSILKADTLTILFPAAVSQALRQLGVHVGSRVTQRVIRKYVGEDLLKTVAVYGAKYLGIQVTKEAVAKKTIPLVGMGIGAGWNWLEVQFAGTRAVRYYLKQPIGPVLWRERLPDVRAIRKLLPFNRDSAES